MSANSAGSAATHERLVALVSPVIERAGYELEELVLTPMGRRSLLRVVIDRDDGISLDDVAGMSHAIADVLDDDEGVIGKAPYVLEVTSPGVDRPLTQARHWRRANGRLVEVTAVLGRTDDGTATAERLLRGRVAGFDGSAVTLTVDGADRVLPLADLGPGRVQLEFNRADQTAKPERQQRQRRSKTSGGEVEK